MAISHIGRLTSEKIDQEVRKTANDLVSGSATDMETYRWQVGYVEGLKTALRFLEESEKQ